jgi:hypothetical protein
MGFFEIPDRRAEFQRFLEGHRPARAHVNYRMFQEPAAREPEPVAGLRISGRDDVVAESGTCLVVDPQRRDKATGPDGAPAEPQPATANARGRPAMRLAQ